MGSEMTRYAVLKEIAEARKSTRSYSDRPVADEDIEKILVVAKTSPFASGRKRWDVLVVQDKKSIHDIAEATRSWIQAESGRIRDDLRDGFLQYTKNFTFFEQAPVLFIPVFRLSKSVSFMMEDSENKIAEWERDAYTKSISAVATLILLAAESLALQTCYMTGPLIAEERIIPLLKIKNGWSIGAIIPAGYER